MTLSTLSAPAPSTAPEVTTFAHRIIANCLDITSLWSIGHAADDADLGERLHILLAFADNATLRRLRRSEHLHDADIEFLVVVDGDVFESAWGPSRLSGSLARWAWRRISTDEAFYDESRWAAGGGVVRTRRKAFLVWQSPTPA